MLSDTQAKLLKIVKGFRRYVYDYEVTTQFNLSHKYMKPSTLERRLRELREAAKLDGGKRTERRKGKKVQVTKYRVAA